MPLAIVVLGVVYGVFTALFSLVVPLRLAGVFQPTGAFGQPIELSTTDLPWLQAHAAVLTPLGFLSAAVLIYALVASRRKLPAGRLVLAAWWGVTCIGTILRGLGITALLAYDQPAVQVIGGLTTLDDLCCGLPITAGWLVLLGVVQAAPLFRR